MDIDATNPIRPVADQGGHTVRHRSRQPLATTDQVRDRIRSISAPQPAKDAVPAPDQIADADLSCLDAATAEFHAWNELAKEMRTIEGFGARSLRRVFNEFESKHRRWMLNRVIHELTPHEFKLLAFIAGRTTVWGKWVEAIPGDHFISGVRYAADPHSWSQRPSGLTNETRNRRWLASLQSKGIIENLGRVRTTYFRHPVHAYMPFRKLLLRYFLASKGIERTLVGEFHNVEAEVMAAYERGDLTPLHFSLIFESDSDWPDDYFPNVRLPRPTR